VLNLHFLCQTLILFAKAVQFCRISFLTPLRFSTAKRLNLKPPSFQLSACYSKLLGYAALRCARLIKPINGACFKLVGICSSMLSHLVPLSWTGVKYPTVREQAPSSMEGLFTNAHTLTDSPSGACQYPTILWYDTVDKNMQLQMNWHCVSC